MKAVILSGGASKGAFQVGVLRELLKQDPDYDADIWAGISVGALNASLLATDELKNSLPELESIWFEKVKGNRSIWNHHLLKYILIGIIVILLFTIAAFVSFILTSPKWLTLIFGVLAAAAFYLPYYSLTHTHSIYDTAPLKKLVNEDLDLSKLRSSGKKLIVGAVSFTSGRYKSVRETEPDIKKWILASSAFPVFFPMVKIGDEYWTDGGVIDIAPFTDALQMGATDIDIILTSPIKSGNFYGNPGIIPKQLMRNIDIMSSEILRNDIEAKCFDRDIKVRIFMPDHQLTSNSLNFDPVRIRVMYDKGREVARAVLEEKVETLAVAKRRIDV